MIQVLLIMIFILFIAILARTQIWYYSYRKERDKRDELKSIYVMNLKERELEELNKQGFVLLIRTLFLLSQFYTFIKNMIKDYIVFVKVKKQEVLEDYKMYEVIKTKDEDYKERI